MFDVGYEDENPVVGKEWRAALDLEVRIQQTRSLRPRRITRQLLSIIIRVVHFTTFADYIVAKKPTNFKGS